MTRSEFRTITDEVFNELLPKVKVSDRRDAITELMNELEANGLELPDDEGDFTDESLEA